MWQSYSGHYGDVYMEINSYCWQRIKLLQYTNSINSKSIPDWYCWKLTMAHHSKLYELWYTKNSPKISYCDDSTLCGWYYIYIYIYIHFSIVLYNVNSICICTNNLIDRARTDLKLFFDLYDFHRSNEDFSVISLSTDVSKNSPLDLGLGSQLTRLPPWFWAGHVRDRWIDSNHRAAICKFSYILLCIYIYISTTCIALFMLWLN